MDLSAANQRLKEIEGALAASVFVEFATFERSGRILRVAVTEHLRKASRKAGVWRSREIHATIKNASYGFDDAHARSVGGRDGIFCVDRDFRPSNEMMAKLFNRFLDKPDSGADKIAGALGVALSALLPVRLVSHHLRLLGVLARKSDVDWLVLVDCDRST